MRVRNGRLRVLGLAASIPCNSVLSVVEMLDAPKTNPDFHGSTRIYTDDTGQEEFLKLTMKPPTSRAAFAAHARHYCPARLGSIRFNYPCKSVFIRG